ncbi:AMIN-like domain-containing (lipo)protein [Amnibacterium sp.]|uniref:AMIN-like domain-containing (lipo)protein n=1 Tax=Amnibacterium sp. TaxID=1872496 RepID=UPI003F7B450D
MRRFGALVIPLVLCGLLAGCGTASPTASTPATSASRTTGIPATRPATASPSASPSASATGGVVVSSVTTHPFGVPTPGAPVVTTHRVSPPVLPPPAPPLPCLRQVAVGAHAGYDQVSFRFTGGFPSYDVQYVAAVTAGGSGRRVPVAGVSRLRVLFRDAQAHDESGRSTVTTAPARPVGLTALADVAPAEDFEGQVVYAVGVAVPPSSGAGRVRIVEVVRTEGATRWSIVALQIATR